MDSLVVWMAQAPPPPALVASYEHFVTRTRTRLGLSHLVTDISVNTCYGDCVISGVAVERLYAAP